MDRVIALATALAVASCGSAGAASDACPEPTTVCAVYLSPSPICADLRNDPLRCGDCSRVCEAPSCADGVCFQCPTHTAGGWRLISAAGSPARRVGHTAVWTGAEMIVWGGGGGASVTDTGGRYDPAVDRWTITSPVNAPAPRSGHTAVWTGAEMIVWGGLGADGSLDTGGRYDPVTDSWAPLTTSGAPDARASHAAVWTGTVMLVWGGSIRPTFFNTGGRYDPVTDTWSPMTTTGAPSPREGAATAWTGSELLVWSGYSQPGPGTWGVFATGGRYDPLSDSWRPISSVGAPLVGEQESPYVWTEAELVVVGTLPGSALAAGAFAYDPAVDAWRETAPRCDQRLYSGGVWTGREVVMWGGMITQGLPDCRPLCNDVPALGEVRYDPSSDSWSSAMTADGPSGTSGVPAVWTGAELLVWGVALEGDYFDLGSGGRYRP